MAWMNEAHNVRIPQEEQELDPQKLYQELLDCGQKWADAQAAYDLLHETKKVVLANLKNQSQAKSEVGKETEALAHPDYMEHIVKLHKAARDAMRYRVQYESLRVYIDLLRSKIALKRAEMQLV